MKFSLSSLFLFLFLFSSIEAKKKNYIITYNYDYVIPASATILGKTDQGVLISLQIEEKNLIKLQGIIHYEEDTNYRIINEVRTEQVSMLNSSETTNKFYIDQKLNDKQYNLDQLDSLNSTYNNIYRYYYTGKNVNIYIVDSGIYPNEDISNNILYERGIDMTRDVGGMYIDCLGHGTHVSSIAVGKISGVAKNANLISVKVFDCTGVSSMSIIIRALEWIKNQLQTNEKCVINMSLIGENSIALLNIIKTLNNKCVVVVAAGNSRSNSCLSSPSNSKEAITVGAINKENEISYYSNYGECVKIFAPGDSIIGSNNIKKGFISKSGTSMATPHVSGYFALLYEEFPNYSIEQIKQKSLNMGQPGVIFLDNKYGPNLIIKTINQNIPFKCSKIKNKKNCLKQSDCFFKKICRNKK